MQALRILVVVAALLADVVLLADAAFAEARV